MSSPRPRCHAVLAVALVVLALLSLPTTADAAKGQRLQLRDVAASASGTYGAAEMSVAFRVRNPGDERKPGRYVRVFLELPGGAQQVGRVRVSAIKPRSDREVSRTLALPSSIPAGSYSASVCLPERPKKICSRTATASVVVAPAPTAPTAPRLTASPTALTLDDAAVGQVSAASTVTITNVGTGPTSALTVAVTDPFSVTGTTCSAALAPQGSCEVSVVFEPAAAGPTGGRLTVAGGTAVSVAVPLSATGVVRRNALAFSPSSYDFGVLSEGGDAQSHVFTLSNEGEDGVSGLAYDLVGSDQLSLGPGTTCGSTLPAGASCDVEVVYDPSDLGELDADLVVTSVRGDRAQAALTGSTVAPVSIEPSAHDYGDVSVGSVESYTYELVNHTSQDLPLTAGGLSDYGVFFFDYADGQNSCLENVIPAHGSCTFSVAFQAALGEHSTTATFGGGPFTATSALTATGVEAVSGGRWRR